MHFSYRQIAFLWLIVVSSALYGSSIVISIAYFRSGFWASLPSTLIRSLLLLGISIVWAGMHGMLAFAWTGRKWMSYMIGLLLGAIFFLPQFIACLILY